MVPFHNESCSLGATGELLLVIGKDQGWLVEAVRVPGELCRAFTNRSKMDPVMIKHHKTALLLTSTPKRTGAS
jgi:hypothetical protein